MGIRVFTRGIWYALLIYSCFGLLTSGKQILFPPIKYGVMMFYVVMLLRYLFFADYPDSTTEDLKNLRFVTSFIILSIMFYFPFNYPTTDVLVTTFSFVAGGISIYQLSHTIEIGHALLIVFLAILNGKMAIEIASQDSPSSYGCFATIFFQYFVYVYNFEFLGLV